MTEQMNVLASSPAGKPIVIHSNAATPPNVGPVGVVGAGPGLVTPSGNKVVTTPAVVTTGAVVTPTGVALNTGGAVRVNEAVRGTQPHVTVVSSANKDAIAKHTNDIEKLQELQARMAAPNPKHSYIPPSPVKKVVTTKPGVK